MFRYLVAALFLLMSVASPAWATKTEDTFVDAGAPICLPSHTPTGGGAWTFLGGTTCAAGSAGTQINASGHVRSFTAATSRFQASDTSTDDMILQFTVGANPPDGWFFSVRDHSSASSTDGIVFDLICGTTSYLGDAIGDSYSGGYVASSGNVTCSTGDVFKVIVSGSSVVAQKCPGGTSCATITGLNWTTTNYLTGHHVGFASRSILTDVLTGWMSDDYSSNTITISEPDGATGTGWHRTAQIIPTDVSQTYATVTYPGGYTGTAGTNVDLQWTSDAAGTSVVQAWTTCTTTATIGSGAWSCPMHVPASWNVSSMLHVMARWTNNTAVTTGTATTATHGVGVVLALLGQSQLEHSWTHSSQVIDCHTTNASPTVTSAVLAAQSIASAYLNGWPITGTNIPGGTTIQAPYNAGTGSVTMSANATGTTSAGTCNYDVVPGSASAVAMRYQGGTLRSVLGTAVAPQVGEGDYSDAIITAPNGNPEGAIELGTNVSTVSGGGSMQLQFALTGTSVCAWTSTAVCTGQTNSSYTDFTSTNGLPSVGNDFNAIMWAQGGTDALNMILQVTGAADNGSGKIRLTVNGVTTSPTGLWTTGETVTVSGITGTGVPGCLNTAQVGTIIDATHIDLLSCSSSGFTYTANGKVTNFSTTKYSAYLQDVETWTHAFRASAPFMVMPLGTFNGDSDPDNYAAAQAIRQAHLAEIDAGRAVWGGGEIDSEHQDEYHLGPKGRVQFSRRIPQAYERAVGLSTSGYGPKLVSAAWFGTKVRMKVLQEGSATLTCGQLSTSCSAITGFRCYSNGSLLTISSTALVQPNYIDLTLSAVPVGPTVACDYQAGQNPVVTNAAYDNQAPFSDTQGLPLQPSRGLIIATSAGFTFLPPFGIAANDNETDKLKRVAGK